MPDQSATFGVLGVRLHAVQIDDVVSHIESWIALNVCGKYVCASNVHSVIEARHHSSFREVLNSADLCVPDGMPLVWAGRVRGHELKQRVSGPDLLYEFCRSTSTKGYKHFFYGDTSETLGRLVKELTSRFPSLNIVGSYSPPFRSLSTEEDTSIVRMINFVSPDVLWVGLGCPKQERWMYEHRDRLLTRVMVGVGQAFAIHAGQIPRAPLWLREHGFEWLFRLLMEPGRLWKRYLVYNAQFLCLLFLEALRLKKFD